MLTGHGRCPADLAPGFGRPSTLSTNVPRPTALFSAPRLRDLRLARRLSQAKLATLAHVARDSIGNLENGGVARAETLERLAGALDVPVDELQAETTASR